ncbi:MAG: hypothetical protein KIS66_02990 [Fimbriimonadaceae bacterium]|nr:hypothetical protein [Fimbriimonadaceae bacterium]
MNDRDVFTEAQVAQIIRVAARRHGSDSGGGRDSGGISRLELERLAQEVGIAPTDLSAAIEQVRSGDDSGGPPWRKRTFERVVEGEYEPAAYAEAILSLPVSGLTGQPTAMGNTFRTAYMAGLSSQELKVVARDGRTRMRVESTPGAAVALSIPLLFFSTLISCVMTFKERLPMPGAIVLAIGYGLAYLLMRGTAKAGAAFAQRVLDEMGEALERATPADSIKAVEQPTADDAELPERLTLD